MTPLPNPTHSETCGLDIGIVLDLSNSLTDEDVANSKAAAKAVAGGLNGTPSRMSVNTFATFGPDGTNSPIPSRSVATSDSVDSLSEEIDALQRVPSNSGGTNWDRGLGQLDGTNHDLVLFVTDGKPTAYGVPGADPGNDDRGTRTDQIDIDTAVESANSLKSQGTKVVGLGVGSEINEDNIKLVSGQTEDDDYYVVSDYSQLADQLREIATKSCRGTLNVTKLIDPGAGQHGVETDVYRGEGWTISSPDSTDGAEKITNADGTVSFRLKTPAEDVQATEVQQAGYRLQQQSGENAICTVNGREIGTENIDGGFALTETVGTDEIVACQLVNEQDPGSLTWKKVDEDGNDLAGAEFTLTGPDGQDFIVTDNGELDVNDADGQFEVTDFAWGNYTIKETAAPDGYVPSEETQTVTISGEGLEKSYVDIVNEKDDTVGVDVEADKDASTDPDADQDASTDTEATATDDTEAAASDDSDADNDSNPAAQATADEEADDTASAAANENAEATASENSAADTDADPNAAADPDAAAVEDADANVDAAASASASATADADDDGNPAAHAAAQADADNDADNTASAADEANASSSDDADQASTNAGSSADSDSGSDSGSHAGSSTSAGSSANDSGSSNGGSLPRTGAGGTLTMIGLAALLIVGGAAAVFASRRYRAQAERH